MRRYLLLALLSLLLYSCHQQSGAGNGADSLEVNEGQDLVLRISNQAKLYTAEYQVRKVVTNNDILHLRTRIMGHDIDEELPLGDRKIAIPIDVTLKACIDFQNFSAAQVMQEDKRIHIILPDPQVIVTSSRVDHEGTRQYSDFLRSDYSDAEMTSLTAQGVQSILQSIPEMGILETARQSAAATLIPMLTDMGYDREQITITFRKEYTASDLTDLYDNEGSVVKYQK